MKIVACYIRVSPGGKNQASQRRKINQWLNSNRIKAKTVQWYIDKETSYKPTQPELERLRGDLMPRLWNSRNEARLRELAERLACLEGQLAAT